MVVFDLKCATGHSFEGWFENLEDMENQIGKGMVACPVCGDASVRRVPSSFGIAKHRGTNDWSQEEMAKVLGKAVQKHLRENFEDVGPQFAKEALKIHYGVTEARNIRGVSTPEEENMLRAEGVGFFKIETPAAPPDTTPKINDGDDQD